MYECMYPQGEKNIGIYVINKYNRYICAIHDI